RAEEHLQALAGEQVTVEEEDVLVPHPADAAAHAVADLAQEDLLAHTQTELRRELLQLLAERLVPPAHRHGCDRQTGRLQAPRCEARCAGSPRCARSPRCALAPSRDAR